MMNNRSESTRKLRVVMAQQNYIIGAVEHNAKQIMDVILEHQANSDIIVFSELSLTGYLLEDWVYRAEFHQRVEKALTAIQAIVENCYVFIGYPWKKKEKLFNMAVVFYEGHAIQKYSKQHLPNYGIFDEKRYYSSGSSPCVFSINDVKVGLLICEDIWFPGPWKETVDAGAELIISLNASPFDKNKLSKRELVMRQRQANEGKVPVIYVNLVGGQDELIFDGQSLMMNAEGEVCYRAKVLESDMLIFTLHMDEKIIPQPLPSLLSQEALIYQALVLGTRDYATKNGFNSALVGLSGGIDSALVLAIAVDAFGPENVEAVMMPSCYTSLMSQEDALEEIEALGVQSREISIETVLDSFVMGLDNNVKNITEQNLQARIRGVFLMALSNETGKLLLTTSNKSETAVGYCTLYGDMCGGLAVIKDILKTYVYRLAEYRNTLGAVIPTRVLERAPSAELAFEQTDQDSLPPYEILDKILEQYIEQTKTPDEIIATGIDAKIVSEIIQLLHRNEYKRRQSAPGLKVSYCAFGRDWRYPITFRLE